MDPNLDTYQAGDKLKYKTMLKTRLEEFYNKCHVKQGRFGERNDPACGNTAGAEGIKVVGTQLSTSVPTAVGSGYKAGDTPQMGLGLVTDEVVPKIVAKMQAVPGFEDIPAGREGIEEIVNRQAENIEDLYETARTIGTDTSEAHAEWYPFVNEWAQDLSAETGFPPEAIMAATAVLSPSADWANNVSWAQTVARTIENQDNITVAPEWIAAQYMASAAAHEWKIKKHGAANEKLISEGKEPKSFTIQPPDPEKFTGLVDKKLSDLSDTDAAVAMRGAHESFGKAVHQLGGHAGMGDPKNIATPQSLQNFAKAISILRNPTTENIDAQLGKSHKVRSFYANMRDPLNKSHQEVTVDSHHLGVANGLPLASAHPIVKAIYDAPKVASTGLVGTYALTVEATRRATARINKKYKTNFTPNQIQSITWEAHRGIFPSEKRSSKLVDSIGSYRAAYRRGEISKNEMLARIENARLGANGPTLEQVRKKFLDELSKGN